MEGRGSSFLNKLKKLFGLSNYKGRKGLEEQQHYGTDNPFENNSNNQVKDKNVIDFLYKKTQKLDKSTYPNTYVWIEKFKEDKNKYNKTSGNTEKSNVIKAKKRG